jgi:hypothetical protein
MAQASTTTTALSLTAGAGLYQNATVTANAYFASNRASYEGTSLIGNLLVAISAAATDPGLAVSAPTLDALKTIGSNVSANYAPWLGDTAPSNVSVTLANTGLAAQIAAQGSSYVADNSQFVQAFAAAAGFVGLTNLIINSTLQANNYLGPTFSNMTNLITADMAKTNLAFEQFGLDLTQCGNLFSLDNLAQFGTPAALLQQLSEQGNMINGTLPQLQQALIDQGLSLQDIKDLVNNNVQGLFNPQGLTQPRFDQLQKQAYPALLTVQGDDLDQVTNILGVTTPNINTMADLLNPVKIFPRSFASLTLPTPNGDILIYDSAGSVQSLVEQILNSGSLVPQGCDQLAKIIPADQAVANRALQVAFAQVKNISGTDLTQLAEILT